MLYLHFFGIMLSRHTFSKIIFTCTTGRSTLVLRVLSSTFFYDSPQTRQFFKAKYSLKEQSFVFFRTGQLIKLL